MRGLFTPILAGLALLAAGCTVASDAVYTVTARTHQAFNDARERHRDHQLAAAAWDQFRQANPDAPASKDFADGFRDGYAEHLYRGVVRPPTLAPSRYRSVKYQSPAGYQAAEEWMAGFARGIDAAKASGWRTYITGPLLGRGPETVPVPPAPVPDPHTPVPIPPVPAPEGAVPVPLPPPTPEKPAGPQARAGEGARPVDRARPAREPVATIPFVIPKPETSPPAARKPAALAPSARSATVIPPVTPDLRPRAEAVRLPAPLPPVIPVKHVERAAPAGPVAAGPRVVCPHVEERAGWPALAIPAVSAGELADAVRPPEVAPAAPDRPTTREELALSGALVTEPPAPLMPEPTGVRPASLGLPVERAGLGINPGVGVPPTAGETVGPAVWFGPRAVTGVAQ